MEDHGHQGHQSLLLYSQNPYGRRVQARGPTSKASKPEHARSGEEGGN